jgi:hypothetical protein
VRSDTGSEFREQCCGDYGRGDQADGPKRLSPTA